MKKIYIIIQDNKHYKYYKKIKFESDLNCLNLGLSETQIEFRWRKLNQNSNAIIENICSNSSEPWWHQHTRVAPKLRGIRVPLNFKRVQYQPLLTRTHCGQWSIGSRPKTLTLNLLHI